MKPSARIITESIGWLELGNTEEAWATLETLAPAERASMQVLFLRARILKAARKWREALMVLDGLSAREGNQVLDYERAICHLQLGDETRARQLFENAMRAGDEALKVRALDDPLAAPLWKAQQ
ncbi:MAG TPA: hypothetical protein VEH27_00725 [Methylomirabilota bacterium]|nr:hypothetical protein [Methylomirabilota bacterium]